MSRTIMLIHGSWLTPASFNAFCSRYEARGYHCIAPAWPHMGRPLSELRNAPHPQLSQLTLGRIVDRYQQLVLALREPPILIGHSLGGLIVQLLLDRGLGAAGVAIAPAPPKGVLSGPRAMLSTLPLLGRWRGWSRIAQLSPQAFARRYAHTLSPQEQQRAFLQHVVPAPGRLFYQVALGLGTELDFRNPDRAPLLMIAGELDRIAAPRSVRAAYQRHCRSPALTAYHAFPDRTHWLIAAPGWAEVADYALGWAAHHALTNTKRHAIGRVPFNSAA
ncbi:alpha/beta hydrolase [Chitinimonas naiadis]